MISSRFKISWFLLPATFVGSAMAAILPAEPSVNLLPNPSFEETAAVSAETPLPGEWTLVSFDDRNNPVLPEEAVIVDDPAQAHSGKHFLRLKSDKRGIVLLTPRLGDFEPGLYEVSAWVKGTPGTNGPMGMTDLGANFGAGVSVGRNEWRKFSMTVYSSGVKNYPWQEHTSLMIGANKMEGGVLDIDDVSVTRLNSGLSGEFSDYLMLQRDKPVPVWGWAKDPGQPVKVEFNGQTKMATADADGRWKVVFDPMPAGGPYVLSLDGRPAAFDVMVGDVWVCIGQSNMDFGLDFVSAGYFGHSPEVLAQADHPMLRLWTAPKQVSTEPMTVYRLQQDENRSNDNYQANWNRCTPESVSWGVWGGFSAVGYYFGRDLMESQKIPVGLMMITNGGTQIESFMSPEALAKVPRDQWQVPPTDQMEKAGIKNDPFPKLPDDIKPSSKAYGEAILWGIKDGLKAGMDGNSFNYAGVLYNGMISPMAPFAIKGVIWYQGEHNSGDLHYAAKLKAFIEQWRKAQNDPHLTFIVVQLCDWGLPELKDPGFAITREAQLKVAQEDPHVGLAVTLDLANDGEIGFWEIHPKNKKDVGLRAALAARKIAYGEKLVDSGPLYRSMKVDGDKIRLSFESVGGGLVAKGADSLLGFEIAGSNQEFVAAQAEIDGDTVVVHAEGVSDPKSVRYAFHQHPQPFNLYNKEGLPASPFRTDDWVPPAPK